MELHQTAAELHALIQQRMPIIVDRAEPRAVSMAPVGLVRLVKRSVTSQAHVVPRILRASLQDHILDVALPGLHARHFSTLQGLKFV
ncbi:hypothetical protein N7488_002318 [Penicillium malachiteum]|nr:hypothetical protein N7488_002318 [Penicillium malachiteum]